MKPSDMLTGKIYYKNNYFNSNRIDNFIEVKDFAWFYYIIFFLFGFDDGGNRKFYKNGMFLQTAWEIIRWKLFGELRIFKFIAIIFSIFSLTLFACLGYVIFHFISKYW